MLADASGLLEMIKRASLEAQAAAKPVNVQFGEVKSTVPLKICVEQKMLLGEAQLILARHVTEYRAEMTVLGEPKKEVVVHNALKVGDKVILVRQQDGQKFIVVDRIRGGEQ